MWLSCGRKRKSLASPMKNRASRCNMDMALAWQSGRSLFSAVLFLSISSAYSQCDLNAAFTFTVQGSAVLLFNNSTTSNGPYTSAPKNLISDPIVANMPDGQMFYSITYGKGQMGSYASQLSTKQRWEVIAYIKSKQVAPAAAAKPAGDTATAKKP